MSDLRLVIPTSDRQACAVLYEDNRHNISQLLNKEQKSNGLERFVNMDNNQRLQDDWLFASIEEYKTIREEALASLKNQQSSLSFGMASAGVLIAVGAENTNRLALAGAVFFIFLPLLCYVVMTIWMGEVARMMRAGVYVRKVELKVNMRLSAQPVALGWEKWLREGQYNQKRPQMRFNYAIVIGMFFAIAFFSLVLGHTLVWNKA